MVSIEIKEGTFAEFGLKTMGFSVETPCRRGESAGNPGKFSRVSSQKRKILENVANAFAQSECQKYI